LLRGPLGTSGSNDKWEQRQIHKMRTGREPHAIAHLRIKSFPLVLREKMSSSERATAWSITINNPTESDMTPTLPAKWVLTGQVEQGEEGTIHYQAMLKTPQERFSAVKKVFPRAHIEVARNSKALGQYVHKAESRLAERPDVVSNIPTLWDYQHTIAKAFRDDEFIDHCSQFQTPMSEDDLFMGYLDDLVRRDIEKGVCGVEFIAINPMWRSAWKKFGRAMIKRERGGAQPPADAPPENEIIYPE